MPSEDGARIPAPKRRRWLPAITAAKYGDGTSSLEMSKDGEKCIMIARNALCAMCLAGLVGGGAAQAGTNDILIGIDNKITYGPEGQINGAPGNDAVLVVDISDPAKPVTYRPRPIRPVFFEELAHELPAYWQRLVVRPGLTGLAQVRRGYETSMAEKLAHDLEWIADRSVRLYLRTVFATGWRVLKQSLRGLASPAAG